MLNSVFRGTNQPQYQASQNWEAFLQKIEGYMTIDEENDMLTEINNLLAFGDLKINEQIEHELSLKGYQIVKKINEIDMVKQASQDFLHKGLKIAINNSNQTPLLLTKQIYEGIMIEGKSPTGKLTIDQPDLEDSKVYIFVSDPDPCQRYGFPSNIQETLQAIINARENTPAIKSKNPLETPDERSLRKFQKYKKADLGRLQQIVKNIDIFCSSKESEKGKRSQALYDIGQYAGDVKFNDRKKYKEEYLRNKYGSTDRSNNATSREGGLELDYLKALQHIAAINLKSSSPKQINLCPSQKDYSSLISDFELIKKKIQFIAKDENSVFTKEEINKEFKQIGVVKCIKAFVNEYYINELIQELIRNLADPQLQKLDLTKREDRYYLGRTLSMIGELSKDIKNFLYPENTNKGNLFSFFIKIRNKKMAHHPGVLVNDISPEQANQFHLLLNIFKKFEGIVENVRTNGLGETTESESQQLNKLIDSLFGKNFVEVDQTILDKTGLVKKQELSQEIKEFSSKNREKNESKQKILIRILDLISEKIDNLNKKMTPNQLKAFRRSIRDLIKSYNSADVEDHLKLTSNEFPSREKLDSLKAEIEKLDLQYLDIKVEKQEKTSNNPSEPNHTTANSSSTSVPPVNLEKTRKNLEKALSMIAKEFEYMMKVLESNEIEDFKKQYIIDFAITKIGQIFVDSEESRNQLLSVFPKDHLKSIKEMTKTRHKLMHEIHASNSGNRRHVLFHHALPIMPEIEALKKIASQKKDGEHGLLTLGRAYTEMKCYDKAIEFFDQMLQLSGSHFLSINRTVSNKDVEHFGQALNALFGIAEAYGKAGDDALAAQADKEATRYYKLKVHTIQQHLELLKNVDDIEKPIVLPAQIASTHNNLGNVYSYLEDYDNALNCFKKSFQILKSQDSYDRKREATYLYNIGRTYFRKSGGINCYEADVISSEAIRNLQLALAALWEANEIYENLPGVNKNDQLFLNIRICLIEALFLNDKDYHPYAIKMFNEFKHDLDNSPIRETDVRLNYIEEVNRMKQYFEKKQTITSVQENVSDEFKVVILNNLKALYGELGIDDHILNNKLNELIKNSQCLNPTLIQEQYLFDLNLKAGRLLRAGQPEQALPLYLKALAYLEQNVKHLMPAVYGDLLESIGDTYISLKDPKNALKFLKLSLEAHFKYEPNDRAFFIPRKCYEEMNKIEKNQKNLLFLKEVIEKFKAAVGENDPRMKALMVLYKQLNAVLPVSVEDILLKYANNIKTTSRYLIIPKNEVSNFQAFQEHCQKFMNAKCTEDKGNYKIFLNETGKKYLQQLQARTSK